MSKVDFTTGNFDLVIDGELNPDKQSEAIDAGIRYIVQRDGATTAYKSLFGESNAKRKTLEFSAENAEAIRSAFADALSKYGNFSVSVSEHIASEGVTSRKQATVLWEKAKAGGAKGLRNLSALLGVELDASNDEVAVEACHEFLKGLRKA